jgi:hypothetical protein
MAFIETVSEDHATGAVADLYREETERFGYLPNLAKVFSSRPEAYVAWRQLNGTIKGAMELRRYELATLAAAKELRSSYCALAHGSVLLEQFMDADSLQAVVSDHRDAGLDEADVAVMDLAEKVRGGRDLGHAGGHRPASRARALRRRRRRRRPRGCGPLLLQQGPRGARRSSRCALCRRARAGDPRGADRGTRDRGVTLIFRRFRRRRFLRL